MTQRMVFWAALAAFCMVWIFAIDDTPIRKDAAENTLMAVNLSHHGTISMSEREPIEPSMFREPLPPFVSAGAVAIVDAVMGPAAAPEYLAGARVQALKYVNVLWAALLFACVYLAARRLTASFPVSLLVAVLTVLPFSAQGAWGVNDLYTDVAGAALIAASSLALLMAHCRERWPGFLVAGLSLGALTLTKASFLYIVAPMLIVLAPIYVVIAGRGRRARRALHVLLVALSWGAVIAPWMYRNSVTFDTPTLAERGGIGLYTRALMDTMTAEEYRGSFYAWAPRARRPMSWLLGFSMDDFERDGRLARLAQPWQSRFLEDDLRAADAGRPEETVTFQYIARAEFNKVRDTLAAQGEPRPISAADRIMLERAKALILDNLAGHLAVTVPLIWRSAPLMFPLVLCAVVLALVRKRVDFLVFSVLGFAWLAFEALLTIGIPRYAIIAQPTAMVAGAFIVAALWQSSRAETLRSRVAGAFSRYGLAR